MDQHRLLFGHRQSVRTTLSWPPSKQTLAQLSDQLLSYLAETYPLQPQPLIADDQRQSLLVPTIVRGQHRIIAQMIFSRRDLTMLCAVETALAELLDASLRLVASYPTTAPEWLVAWQAYRGSPPAMLVDSDWLDTEQAQLVFRF
jgi:hypothetical protein